MTWPNNEAFAKFIDAFLVLKEIHGDEEAIRIAQQEIARELVVCGLRPAKQQALPAPEPVTGKSADLAIALEALDFYADADNWSGKASAASRDKGKRALAAIGKIMDSEGE